VKSQFIDVNDRKPPKHQKLVSRPVVITRLVVSREDLKTQNQITRLQLQNDALRN
jgi:hypothetical protein